MESLESKITELLERFETFVEQEGAGKGIKPPLFCGALLHRIVFLMLDSAPSEKEAKDLYIDCWVHGLKAYKEGHDD